MTEAEVEPAIRCPICLLGIGGDPQANIAPGDELVDHLTDDHQGPFDQWVRKAIGTDI